MTRIQQKLHYGTSTIDYSIVRSKRIKTSEIIVDKDTIEVRTPFNKPEHEIQKIVQNKASWILKKQKEYRDINPQITRPNFEENSTLPYLGKNYPLKILTGQPKNSICFVDRQFTITLLPSSKLKNTPKFASEKIYKQWLMKIADPIFKNKVKEYSKKIGIAEPKKMVIKRLKKRWGSIGKKADTINLNVDLLKAPVDVINYIILHELCHLKIKEHNHRYWDLLHKFMPDYGDKINWLNINGSNLI
jgi:predicted metal-dependent hydrolase